MLTGNKNTKKPACRSQLIRVIRKLYNLKDHAETKNCQKQLVRMKSRHSVLSQPARLELIADLISEKKGFITRQEKVIKGSYYGSVNTRRDFPMLIDLYKQGRLKLDELITGRYKLEEINEAVASVLRGEARRNVIIF